MTSERHFFLFCNFRKWIHIFLGQVKWGCVTCFLPHQTSFPDIYQSTVNTAGHVVHEPWVDKISALLRLWADSDAACTWVSFLGNCMFSRQLYVHCFLCVALLPTIHRNGPLQYDRIVSGMMGQSILFTASVSRRHNANWLGKQRDMSLLGIEPAPLPGQARPLTRLDSSPSARLHVCGCQLLPSHSDWTHIGTSQQSTCRIDSSGNSYAPVGM